MRWFALGLLLVINLVLLLWQVLVQQPEQARPAALPDVGELRLLSELKPAASEELTVSDTDPEVVEELVNDMPEEESVDPAADGTDVVPAWDREDPLVEGSGKSETSSETVPVEIDVTLASTSSGGASEPASELPVQPPDQLPGQIRDQLPDQQKKEPLEALPEELLVAPGLDEKVASSPDEPTLAEEGAGPEVVPEPIPGIRQACWQLGPFGSEEEASELAGRLPEGLQQLQFESVRVKVPNGYYVLIPPLVDRDEALEVERSLKRKGIEDSWVFVSGPLKNAVSLGLFNREINARRRVQRVEAKGFQPEMRPRFREGEQILMLITGPEGKQSENALAQLDEGAPKTIPCP